MAKKMPMMSNISRHCTHGLLMTLSCWPISGAAYSISSLRAQFQISRQMKVSSSARLRGILYVLHFVDALELCEILPLCPREDKLVALYPCSKNASVWWGTVGIHYTAHAFF